MSASPCALIMAGGTGGHIFPGLALAEALRAAGWRVHWLGAPGSMEARLVPPRGLPLEPVRFAGVRGKGPLTLALLPLKLLRAFWDAWRVVRRVRPDVAVGMGGYISFPGGMMAVLAGCPLVLHEQNSVAGLANRVLARVADRVFGAFPAALPQGEWIGNPLRAEFCCQPPPAQRWAHRSGPLRLLVMGGSLGAAALNERVPQALALLPAEQRPRVLHQSGERHLQALQQAYAAAGVQAECVPFIDDVAHAIAEADVVIARAGASTISELAAVGAAALLVPFPHAVDDHQTVNARFLADRDAAWLRPQAELTPQWLADWLRRLTRAELLRRAELAWALRKTDAVDVLVRACTALAAGGKR
ncbi:MAG: undecaprenyldiphospho-muramoylpentapeptide beta-N-acetylglucosaminyltransferase [Tepidimonas sp.]|uniref:undecaprenyldiphospho-muramoylpentapeptide beta-N-acetylglucosaminyltransferase n=1 Tax=Tepidimonas sp. TaxID=2002775 RepID=UPI00298EE72C|nr:undecaprenyldiphospho-muramoylpentapeptide beta-N-acetylglucosaminyltransferase [Tepidimonas sp.]MDW8336065.1 undecaprenyldiphospho-muramoylpentapeptide beta-N-acetylglucosaminyltransferase [Tepidimonas sp.]